MIRAAAALVLLASCAAAPAREESNRDVVRDFVAAINARDWDALEALTHPDLVRHSAATPGLDVRSRAQFVEFLEADLSVFPDSRQEVALVLADGDHVALRAEFVGTQRGPMGPWPATGRAVRVPFVAILRLDAGRVAEIWIEWDNLAILSQLGHALAPPG